MGTAARTCDVNGLNRMIAADKVTVVVATQNGCGHCAPWMRRLKKAGTPLPKDVSLVEVPSNIQGKPECEQLQNKLKVKFTPTTTIYRKGRVVHRLRPEKYQSEAAAYEALRKEIEKARKGR